MLINELFFHDVKEAMTNKMKGGGFISLACKYPNLSYDLATAIAECPDEKLTALAYKLPAIVSVQMSKFEAKIDVAI
ncbi:hypothetical protein [uncultured Umboniibacter sp.]|uniref:hypothetical protein n=1 Tax=uncultured Umboniibacter sp. TaxID=1798917 RepID=UPI002605BF29|nr:hypothetical protein [uncultured Umboniibacter sp.]